MMSREPYSWPLTGGLATKNSPLVTDPSSYIALNNVRMERLNEWRSRSGYLQSSADSLPLSVPPVKVIGLPSGAAWGMCAEPSVLSAGRIYSPSLSTSRWVQSGFPQCAQTTPVSWTRAPLSGGIETAASSGPDTVTMAAGGGYVLGAWSDSSVGTVAVALSDVDGGSQGDFLRSPGLWARCVYATAAAKHCLFVKDGISGDITMYAWVNGILTDNNVPVAAGCDPLGPMDAAYYGGGTITLVARTGAGNQVRYIEFDPSTFVAAIDVNLAVTIDAFSYALSLFSSLSGANRCFVVSNGAPETRVVRVSSAGVIQTNDIAVNVSTRVATGIPNTSLAPADWQIVYETASGTIAAVKKRNGVIGAASNLAAAPPSLCSYRLHSNAWLTPTQTADCMRFIYGFHTADQNSYYEMALVFSGASAAISNRFPEPQARLAALNASPRVSFTGLSQVNIGSSGSVALSLARLTNFNIAGDAPSDRLQRYSVDRWTGVYLDIAKANLGAANLGAGAQAGLTSFMPCGTLLHTAKGGVISSHGAAMLPTPLVLTPGGGGSLTASTLYGYKATVDMYDDIGDVWHSPPTLPATVLLSGIQTSVAVAFSLTSLETSDRKRTVKIWRTSANGSVYRLVHSVTDTVANTINISFNDTVSDTNLANGNPFPTELPTMLTPAVSHVERFGGRLWGADREQPGVLWFSKPLQPGTLPEFVDTFSVDIEDSTGPCTGLAQMDDKLIVFKRNAIYVVFGEGPDNTGGGQNPSVTRIDSDIGNLPGSPTVTTGSEVFFVAQRGIHRIGTSLAIDFVGSPVDQYLNQPLVGTTVSVQAAVFVPSANEVRFECAQMRLVYDRLHNIWMRDTGNSTGALGVSPVASLVLSTGKHAVIMSNATMFVEGSPLIADDGGVAYTPTIRSAWMRPANIDGYMRLYKARLLGLRTAPGGFPSVVAITPTLTIFYDNDDTLFETSQPKTPILGTPSQVRALLIPRRQKCSTFSLQVTLPTSGLVGPDPGADLTFRLEQWAVEIGLKQGFQRNGRAERWT